MSRCRICGHNDRDALVEEMAEALWISYRHDDVPWAKVEPYWGRVFRQLAETAIRVAGR